MMMECMKKFRSIQTVILVLISNLNLKFKVFVKSFFGFSDMKFFGSFILATFLEVTIIHFEI